VYSDRPPTMKRFPVVSWDPREDTFVPADRFCGNYQVVAYQAERVVRRCKGHPSRELLEDRRLRRRGKFRDPVGPGAAGAPASPAGRDRDRDPDARGSSDPPPRRESGDRPGDLGGGILALLEGSDAQVEPLPPLPPPPGDPEGLVEVPPELVPYEPEAEYWGPHPGRLAWARIHVQARKEFYEPTSHGHDSAGGGPVLADLSDERVTQAVFTKDGTQDVRRDKWFELRDGARAPTSPTTFAGRGEWSGVTRPFHKDANRGRSPSPVYDKEV